MLETLTKERVRDGLVISEKGHPEWGTWVLRRAGSRWRIRGESGERILREEDFKFWQIDAPWQMTVNEDPTQGHLVAALALLDGIRESQSDDQQEKFRALEYELRVAAERLQPSAENRRRLGMLAVGA